MRKIAFSYPLLLLAIWTGVLLAGNYVVIETSFHQLLANDFATTTGEIMRSDLKQTGYVKRGVNMSYSYAVNGMDYTGHRYRYDERDGAFDYRAVTNMFRPGSRQKIYYDPADPADSVLAPGLRGCDWLLLVFALPLDVMTAAIWHSVGRSKAPAGGPNRIGRARIFQGKDETRVRLADVTPIAAGFFGAGAAAFVAAMAVVLAAGFAPGLSLMYGVLAFVGIAGAMTFLWMLQRWQRGLYDLRILRSANAIVVPAKAGRAFPLTIPLREITGVLLEKNISQNPSGQYVSYATALYRQVPGTEGVAVPLVNWGWPEVQARALALWLSDELGVPFQDEKKGAKAGLAAVRH